MIPELKIERWTATGKRYTISADNISVTIYATDASGAATPGGVLIRAGDQHCSKRAQVKPGKQLVRFLKTKVIFNPSWAEDLANIENLKALLIQAQEALKGE